MPNRPPPDPILDIAAPGLLCGRCRYELRGLSTRGKCPECGELIEISAARVTAVLPRPPARLALGLGIGSCLAVSLIPISEIPAFQLGLILTMIVSSLYATGICLRRWRAGNNREQTMATVGAMLAVWALFQFIP